MEDNLSHSFCRYLIASSVFNGFVVLRFCLLSWLACIICASCSLVKPFSVIELNGIPFVITICFK